MKRKVIQLAGKTFVVSLPNKWATKYNVKKGDELDVEESQYRLVISTKTELNSSSSVIDISGTSPMIKRILGALYKTGYDEVEIKFTTPEELETALNVIKDEFVGFEVIIKSEGSLYVKTVATIQNTEFDNVLRRIFLVLLSMGEEGIKALKDNNQQQLKSVVLMDLDINKYADFCRRILNKTGYFQFSKTPPLYYIVEELEKTADAVRDMCAYALESREKPSQNVLTLCSDTVALIRAFYEIYCSFNLKKLAGFGAKRDAIKKKNRELFVKSNPHDAIFLLHAYTVLETCFNMNGALLAINL